MAVYKVPGVRLTAGVKIAVAAVRATVPVTGVVPCCKVKDTEVNVPGSIPLLKTARTAVLGCTPVSPLAGRVLFTEGMLLSGVSPVVNLQI